MTLSIDSAMKIKNLSEKIGTLFMPGHVVRFFPEFRKIHDLVKAGTVGRPAVIRLQRGGKMPVGSAKWFSDRTRSGGVLLDLGIHDFDWLRWTFGEVDHVYSRYYGTDKLCATDYSLTTLQFASGAIAHVESSWMEFDGFKTSIEVAGSEGIVSHSYREKAALKITTSSNTEYENSLFSGQDPFALEVAHFKSAIEGTVNLEVTPEDGCWAVSIALAALKSAESQQRVKPIIV